ncbi:MAG: hypothetical protein NZ926_00120 [Candidatus Methanomethylicia archaeon]|nr:hypothetical protein [Candidatus Methanomethylicia archaeon]MCX8168840.1 hypothetical protein [Candidatus Methanomethylicia archaeon]MDW7988572.1 hypothetical protein [Nitrososphaerota archaeon]
MKLSKLSLILLLLIITLNITTVLINTYAKFTSQYSGLYEYACYVDDDGVSNIVIIYQNYVGSGSSWLLVPRNFTKYTVSILDGIIVNSEVKRAYTATGEVFTFYDNFTFTYIGNPKFKLQINYVMDNGALIVEPRGFFYSPQIYFNPKDKGVVYVYLPGDTKVNNVQPQPTNIEIEGGRNKVTVQLQSNNARVAVEYIVTKFGKFETYSSGIFHVITPTRYLTIAKNLIETYNTFYRNLTKIFNVNLTEVKIQFFAPRIADLGIGGYIPFNGTHLGNIYLNLLYIRTVQGFWEQIALHELIHHFVWAAGISPNLLWVHEGLAEYLSIKLTIETGWEGALSRKKTLESTALKLGGKYGFVQWWNPVQTPQNIADYYAASYMIIKEVVEGYGGLTLLQKLFNRIKGSTISDTNTFIEYLNIAAGKDLTMKFMGWGFKISEGIQVYQYIVEAKYLLMNKRLAQPIAFIANTLLDLAQNLLISGNIILALIIGWIGVFMAYTAITLTVILWGGLLVIIFRRLKYYERLP